MPEEVKILLEQCILGSRTAGFAEQNPAYEVCWPFLASTFQYSYYSPLHLHYQNRGVLYASINHNRAFIVAK